MIKDISVTENFEHTCGIWAPVAEDSDLAQIAEYAIAHSIKYISCVPDCVTRMWPWLETTDVKIYARFYMTGSGTSYSDQISDLCGRVRAAFKQGADGAQIFIRASDIMRFVDELSPVRDDLFFGKLLSVGLDISEIEPSDWPNILTALAKIRADIVTFVITKYDEKKSDFVGRVYGALNVWSDNAPAMHFALGTNIIPMGQSARLIQKICPQIMPGVVYWVRI